MKLSETVLYIIAILSFKSVLTKLGLKMWIIQDIIEGPGQDIKRYPKGVRLDNERFFEYQVIARTKKLDRFFRSIN